MDTPRLTTRRIITGLVFLLSLAVILVLAYRYYFHNDNNTTQEQESSDSNYSSSEEQNNTNSSGPATTTDNPDNYYNNSLKLAGEGKYDEAIVEIDKAIALDDKNEIYWSKKASYYARANKTSEEIATLKEGLKIIPDSELLKTKLDLVDKDIDFSGDGVRE